MAFVPIYILILFLTIVVDYFAGIYIEKSEGSLRKFYLIISICVNVGILAIFKYYNFFFSNINGLIDHYNIASFHFSLLKIILPIGLSFHTFQAMSYTIEVYRGNHKAEHHFGIYALYVMFYPQLVAGPIERPQNILYQFHEVKKFDYENLFDGLKRILWGVFKKVVIADRLAIMVDYVYKDSYNSHGFVIVIAIILFGIQIYCDFSGYSDIAVGTAKVLGYELMENFKFPFRSKNITEFWRRWHISLSSWFNDYLFTPILINKRDWGNMGIVFALFITFSLSGLWHGAGWTFIIFGMLHGLAVIFEFLTKKQRKKIAKKMPSFIYNNLSVALTFAYACITWIFFRSTSLHQAMYMLKNIFSRDSTGKYISFGAVGLHGLPSTYLGLPLWQFICSVMLIPFLFFCEWLIENNGVKRFSTFPVYIKWTAFYILIISILFFGVFDTKQFIYFQF